MTEVSSYCVCLYSMSRIITMQGLIILVVKGTEKNTLYSDKVNGARNVGQGYLVIEPACRVCQ